MIGKTTRRGNSRIAPPAELSGTRTVPGATWGRASRTREHTPSRSGRASALPAILFALAFLLIAALAGCGSGEERDSGPTATPLPGTMLDPAKAVGDFTLTGHTGDPFTLSSLRGSVVVMYFGYTSCPDVCPTTLGSYKQTKAILGDDADNVRFVFISVDPERDTTERLASYITSFDPDFIAATGDDATLRTIARDYGVFYQRVDYDNDVNYLVDHTASTFIVGPDGDWRAITPYGTEPNIVATYIRDILASD